MAQSKTIGVNVVGRVTKLEEALAAANKRIAHFTKQTKTGFSGLASSLKGIGTQIIAAFGFHQIFSHFADVTKQIDELNEASKRLGASTVEMSAWAHAAKLGGIEFNELATAFEKFTKAIGSELDDGGKISERLASMGLSAKTLTELPLSDSLRSFADAFQAIPTIAERTAVAFELFGRTGGKFVEFFRGGAAGLDQMVDRAQQLGITIDQSLANNVDSLADSFDDLKASVRGVSQEMLGRGAPFLTSLNQALTANVAALRRGGSGIFGTAFGTQAAVNWLFGSPKTVSDATQAFKRNVAAELVGPPSILAKAFQAIDLVGPPSSLEDLFVGPPSRLAGPDLFRTMLRTVRREQGLSGLADPRSFLGRIDAQGGAMMTIDKAQLKAAQDSSKTLRAIESMIRQFQKSGGLAA